MAFCLCAFLLAFSATAQAARVVLKNGSVLDGLIIDESPGKYMIVRTSQAELRLDWKVIDTVDRSATQGVEEQTGDQLAKQGQVEEALQHYEAAKKSGKAGADIEEKIAAVKKRIEEQELEQYSAHINEARALMEADQIGKAAALLDELANSDIPGAVRKRANELKARIHYQKAQKAREFVDYLTAEAELKKAIETDPNFAQAHVQLAGMWSDRQDMRLKAAEEYTLGLTKGADTLSEQEKNQIRMELARLSQELGDWNAALSWYKAIYASNPRYEARLVDRLMTAYLVVARQKAVQSPKDAAALLSEALEYQPRNFDARLDLARLLADLGDYKEAIDHLRFLQNIDNRRPDVRYLAASCHIMLGQVLDAREQLMAVVQLDPKRYEAWCDLGELSLRGGDISAAEQNFSHGKDVNPGGSRALIGLAKVKRRQQNRKDARVLVETVLKGDPKNREANLEMGNIVKEEKDYPAAKKYFDEVIEAMKKSDEQLSPEEHRILADAYDSRGEVLILLEQPRTARNDFLEALKHYPNYGRSYFNIGQTYIKEGATPDNLKKAEDNMIRARELDPTTPEFAQGLGILYHQYLTQLKIPEAAKREFMKKAVENYQEYLKLGGSDIDNVTKWIEECGGKPEIKR